MGLATAMLFGTFSQTAEILSSVSTYLINLGVFIAIPILFVTFASGTASLMKDKRGRKVALSSVLWAVVTTALLSGLAVLMFMIKPVSFPVTSSAGSAPGTLISHSSYMLGSAANALYPVNAFWSVVSATRFIVPAVIIAWILGIAMKPSADIIRPAYTVMNSFSEVMYRISRTYAVFGFVIVYISSAAFFATLYEEKTVIAAPGYAILTALAVLAAVLLLIPFLYAIFTGFKKNPYKMIYRSLAPALLSFMSSNTIASMPVAEGVARQNLGVQKRIASTSVPLLTIIGKGGSAMVSAIALLSLFQATTGELPSATVSAAAAAVAALISFISSSSAGTEALVITAVTLQVLGINLYGAENALIAFSPLICGAGAAGQRQDPGRCRIRFRRDACAIETDIEVPYKDTV